MTANDLLVLELAVLVDGLVSLSDVVIVLFVSGHVPDFVSDDLVLLVVLAVRSFDEAVLVDACIDGERGHETDVLAFRRLDRAHTAVVGGVDVTDFHGSTLS